HPDLHPFPTRRSSDLTKRGTKCRSINGRVGLRVPRDVLKAKCQQYLKNGKAIHRTELINESDYTIVSLYQTIYRGIVNYYQLARSEEHTSELQSRGHL